MPELHLNDKVYPCKPEIPGWALIELAASNRGDASAGMAATRDFLLAVIEPAHVDQFLADMRASDATFQVIDQAVADLMGAYSERPTRKSSSSPAGQPSTPAISRVVDFSRGTSQDKSDPGQSAAS